uniref:Uncharacterized protein n=1 Tax=Anguilla anguilla TaxID=7936 RepID=A0A0E9RWE3_ANGAN
MQNTPFNTHEPETGQKQ